MRLEKITFSNLLKKTTNSICPVVVIIYDIVSREIRENVGYKRFEFYRSLLIKTMNFDNQSHYWHVAVMTLLLLINLHI